MKTKHKASVRDRQPVLLKEREVWKIISACGGGLEKPKTEEAVVSEIDGQRLAKSFCGDNV
ncbi:MAG: hypothetical protein KGI59_03355 [Patescibacteria group bacterium]|nr:hypothetical protein [Patescibacteria group bacterium]